MPEAARPCLNLRAADTLTDTLHVHCPDEHSGDSVMLAGGEGRNFEGGGKVQEGTAAIQCFSSFRINTKKY